MGTWWTYDAPSLRVADRHRRYVSIWCAGDGGPSLLLVHTPGSDHEFWNPLVPDISEHFTVHALDLRTDARVDIDAVTTALDAVGAGLVLADRNAAPAVIGAIARSPVSSAVLWEPPVDAVRRLRAESPGSTCTVEVISSSAAVLAAAGAPDDQVRAHSCRGPAEQPTTELAHALPRILLGRPPALTTDTETED